MANCDGNFLLVFGGQAKVVAVNQALALSHEWLHKAFDEAFSGQICKVSKHILQRWDDKWQEWLDLEKEEAKELSGKQKIRMITQESDIPKLGNLSPETCAVLCCDMQERFKPAIKFFDEIATVGNRLLKAAYLLDIPVIVTEQYPKGLLHTVPDLDISQAKAIVPKTVFSMIVPEVEDALAASVKDLKSVILFGVEAHVCVQQTALDLLARGVEVHVIADASSSRSQTDRHMAFDRLRSNGATITTAETVLLQLVKDKNHPKFKEVQNIIKVSPPDTGLLTMKSNM